MDQLPRDLARLRKWARLIIAATWELLDASDAGPLLRARSRVTKLLLHEPRLSDSLEKELSIAADDYLRSVTNHDAFVAGDALTGSAQLSPVATYEGKLVGHNIVEEQMKKADYWGIPACVYTVPAMATVAPSMALMSPEESRSTMKSCPIFLKRISPELSCMTSTVPWMSFP